MSEVKVNKISPRTNCGTTQLGDAGDTITVTGDLKSNSLKSASGSTITLGQSGDTIQLGCGATQTGFGRTGTVDWDTTAKTASFTAVSGNGYFVNTTSGAITLTLPATPSAGDIVAFKDYAFTFATNNLTVAGNGSPIGGVDGTINPTYSTNGTSKTFIYVDGTKGWLVTNESTDTSQEENVQYVTATGGTITCCGDYKIHTFTGPGTFCVSCAGTPSGSDTVEYLVVAGGGGGGRGAPPAFSGAGGGAGGFREGFNPGSYCASPLATTSLPVSVTGYPITVGGGGAGSASPASAGTSGSNSIFSTITSAGGGGGGSPAASALSGGSGGGAGAGAPQIGTFGSGNTPPVSPPQGKDGGDYGAGPLNYGAAGGGGAIQAGLDSASGQAGGGGDGTTTSISTSPTAYAGGGGAGGSNYNMTTSAGSGGTGGGGAGGSTQNVVGTAGTVNTGGGAGGGGRAASGGAGGSGIVIIRYKYQ